MKKWNVINTGNKDLTNQQILTILLENRGIVTKKQQEEFLNPTFANINLKSLDLDAQELKKSILRIKKAIQNKEQIIVFGDYDVDGICGSAILWETLSKFEARALPYIPNRFDEGYGLSEAGIDNVLQNNPDTKLIITVDNGIVAVGAVDYANQKGIDVIVTDHHVAAKSLPKAYSIVHTTKLCGAGVAYVLSKQLRDEEIDQEDNHLELVVLATIADLVPLTNANRVFVSKGIKRLQKTKRVGLLELFSVAGIPPEKVDVYQVGHVIAPRLNAMGRLSSAMDSLRLLCTTSIKRAKDLASLLSSTNLQRQEITGEILTNAKLKAKEKTLKNLIFIADKSYQQGVIGLVAGRIVEEFYLPSIVISKGEKLSKASARSVQGFNIIEFLREASDLMVDLGGHPMAAGFTVETEKLELLEKKLYEKAEKLISKDHLERILSIDLEIMDNNINLELFAEILNLYPFGMANPEPLFVTKELKISDLRVIGKEGKHIKLRLISVNGISFEAIYFGAGQNNKLKLGDNISAVYNLSINEWNGNKNLQLIIRDIKLS